MEFCEIEKIGNYVGKEIGIKGWLYNRRSSGKIHFLLVRDGTGIVQCVMGIKDVPENIFHLADELPQESSLIVHGKVREDKRAPGGYELNMTHLEVIQKSEPYPIALKEHGVDFLMENRHLWLRSRKQHSLIRIRHNVISAVRDFFNNQGFICVDTPIFTPAACEGTTTLFAIDYFEDFSIKLFQVHISVVQLLCCWQLLRDFLKLLLRLSFFLLYGLWRLHVAVRD